jgi:DNA-binding NarL/FixJ family response regulator
MTIAVLVADDHAVLRDGLRVLLEAQPDLHVVGDAADGRSAVHLVEELRPDVAIVDIAMPGLNGIEATRQICQSCPDVKTIILSMHSTTEHVSRALQAGARGYLLKESAGMEVVSAVRAVYLSQKISDQVIDDYARQPEAGTPQGPLALLTEREREVLQLVVEGNTSAQIAEMLSLSPKTVDTYRSRLMRKLDIDDLPGLVKFAIQHGLTPLE